MSASIRQFERGLYLEHVEEASFLYEQSQALRADPAIAWARLEDFEERLEAHLDALLIGGELALEICRSNMGEGAGELFTAVCVICRGQHAGCLSDVWRLLDFADVEEVRAVTEALKRELPAAWEASCKTAIARGQGSMLAILAEVGGSRRLSMEEEIAHFVLANAASVPANVVRALSRLPPSQSALKALEITVQDPRAEVRAEAVLGLLRANRRTILHSCHLWAQLEEWPQWCLAAAGARSALPALRQHLDGGRATRATLLALGLLGDLSIVRPLCEYVDHEELGEAAALALHVITGAPLYEEVFLEEAVDEATLFDAELRALHERGEKPGRGDGRPFGAASQRLSRRATVWTQWLSQNARSFQGGMRYRLGQPHSAHSVLAGLSAPALPRTLRQWSYEELVIRYGCPVSFEADWRVAEQRRALRAIAEWIASNGIGADAGQWH